MSWRWGGPAVLPVGQGSLMRNLEECEAGEGRRLGVPGAAVPRALRQRLSKFSFLQCVGDLF